MPVYPGYKSDLENIFFELAVFGKQASLNGNQSTKLWASLAGDGTAASTSRGCLLYARSNLAPVVDSHGLEMAISRIASESNACLPKSGGENEEAQGEEDKRSHFDAHQQEHVGKPRFKRGRRPAQGPCRLVRRGVRGPPSAQVGHANRFS